MLGLRGYLFHCHAALFRRIPPTRQAGSFRTRSASSAADKKSRKMKECADKEVFTLRANSVMCYGISRCLPCCDLLGQRNFPHKVIVNVDLLCAVSAGFIRRINDDFFNQFVKHIWRQFTRLGVFSNTLQETLDVQGLLLTGIYHAL